MFQDMAQNNDIILLAFEFQAIRRFDVPYEHLIANVKCFSRSSFVNLDSINDTSIGDQLSVEHSRAATNVQNSSVSAHEMYYLVLATEAAKRV